MTPPRTTAARWVPFNPTSVTTVALIVSPPSPVVAASCRLGPPDDSRNVGDQARRATAPSDPQAAAHTLSLSQQQRSRMTRAAIVRAECPIKNPAELRVVEVNHYPFDGDIKPGRLVADADVGERLAGVFTASCPSRS